MFTIRWRAYCVLIGAFACAPVMTAEAQDDPFGGLNQDPATVRVAADPAAAAVESPANERSGLAAEPPAEAADSGQDFCRCVGESDSAAVARIEKALSKPLGSNGMDFTDTPLEEVVNLLQEEYGIPIQIDDAALDATGLSPDSPVTINLHNISLRSALRLMLKRSQLTSIIRDEVLLITTPDEAEKEMSTCVYNIRGFVEDTSDRSIDALIDTIVSCVNTESWAENGGGEAEIRPLKPGLIVVSQTQAVHEEVGDLLNAIREMGNMRAAEGDAAAAAPDDESVVTRAYKLQIKHAGDVNQLHKQIRELIMHSFPDEQWDGRLTDGQPVMLTVLGDRVIVRHKSTVQDAVEEILTDSGVAVSADFCGGSGRGGGGIDGDGERAGGLSGGERGGSVVTAAPTYE